MAGATKSIVIDAPIETVFDGVRDYEKYPEYLPEVKSVKVTRKGDEAQVDYEVDVIKRIKYSIKMKETRPTRLEWSFISGEMMKDNKGSWTFEPAGEGKTKATYTVEMALGALVPKTIVNALVETSLPKMLDATKKRVESLKKK